MSCGKKISSFNKYQISDALEREGEYGLARSVRHGDCLDFWQLRRAEDALERRGIRNHWDYSEDSCGCDSGEDY